jgi:hypothetical protein
MMLRLAVEASSPSHYAPFRTNQLHGYNYQEQWKTLHFSIAKVFPFGVWVQIYLQWTGWLHYLNNGELGVQKTEIRTHVVLHFLTLIQQFISVATQDDFLACAVVYT